MDDKLSDGEGSLYGSSDECEGEGEEIGNIEIEHKGTQSRLDKATLNNLIISLRPCIKQAKVHIIHHLSRQATKFRNKKCANDQEKIKNERKAARFAEEISILKRASRDLISRWLVVNKKSFDEVTKQENLTQKFNLRVRVFVRSGEHKTVKSVLDNFRGKYPEWEKEVPKLLRTLGSKRKKTDPNKQELGIKPAEPSAVENKISTTSNSESGPKKTYNKLENGKKADKVLVDVESSEIENKENDSKVLDRNENTERNASETDEEDVFKDGHVFDKDDPENYSDSEVGDNDSSSLEDEVETDSGDEEIFVKSLKLAITKSQDESKPGKIDKKQGEVVVKVLDLNKEEDDIDSDSTTQFNIGGNKNSNKRISSFFVGGESESEEENDGDDEVPITDADEDLQIRQQSLKDKFQGEGRVGAGLNRQKPPIRKGVGRGSNKYGGSFERKNAPKVTNEREGKREIDSRSKASNLTAKSFNLEDSSVVESNLHPSWAAKKRVNTSIAKFEGKKIKFGDQDSVSSPKSNFSVPVIKPSNVSHTEKLHPSWEAKQSQKSSIQAFQGKKVVFDD